MSGPDEDDGLLDEPLVTNADNSMALSPPCDGDLVYLKAVPFSTWNHPPPPLIPDKQKMNATESQTIPKWI
jgi:hypothetical protein